MIKEGTRAIKWTRLSCRSFSANAVLLQLRALSCSNFQIHQDRRQDCLSRPLCRLRIWPRSPCRRCCSRDPGTELGIPAAT